MSQKVTFTGIGIDPRKMVVLTSTKSAPAEPLAPAERTDMDDSEQDALEAIGRFLTSTPTGRGAIAASILASSASASTAFATRPRPQLRPADPGGNDPGSPGAPGGTPGAGTTPGAPPPAVVDGTTVDSFWWGWRFSFDETATHWIESIAGIESVAFKFLAVITASVPAISAFAESVSIWLTTETVAILAVDKGNGVFLNMAWAAPGIFVPTTR